MIKLWFSDPNTADVFAPRAKAWAYRNSATVERVDDEAAADVLCIPSAHLGRFDPPSALQEVPIDFVGEGTTFQWGGLLGVYQSRLAHWGGERCAIPLVGEAYVLVYRGDVLADGPLVRAFTDKHFRPPLPIRTWTELAEVGEFVTERTGTPALAPVPNNPNATAIAFGQIAACYDRPAATGRTSGDSDGPDPYLRGLSFYTDVELLRAKGNDRWEVRITAPAFGEAFRWFERTAKCRPPQPGDVLDSVVSGTAVAVVVPVGELARLPRDPATGAVEARFKVAAVPGADSYFDADGKKQPTSSVNRVPLYTGAGAVGVVRKSAAHPDAAWALLAELGGPAGSSATVASVTTGGGPVRIEQATPRTAHWEQYGFDPARTDELTAAVSEYVAPGTINPALALRTPDLDAVNGLLARAVTAAATGKLSAADAQQQAATEWKALDATTPNDVRRALRRKSAGLE